MRRRWQIVLPVVGLLLFGFINCASYLKEKHESKPGPRKYSWWWGIRLDRRPLEIEPPKTSQEGWEPQYILIELGPLQKLVILTGFPAFLLSVPLIHALDSFGADQLIVFLTITALGLAVWYWFLGWLIDRRKMAEEPKPLNAEC
jgi:hypothetical protein